MAHLETILNLELHVHNDVITHVVFARELLFVRFWRFSCGVCA